MLRRRRQLGITMVLVASLGVAMLAQPASAAPSASVNPTSGPVGTSITVSGSGFTPGFPPCEIRFGGTKVANCTVNANGGVSVGITVPNRTAGSYNVQICNFCGGGEFQESASTTFTITTTPTSSTTSSTTSTTTSTTVSPSPPPPPPPGSPPPPPPPPGSPPPPPPPPGGPLPIGPPPPLTIPPDLTVPPLETDDLEPPAEMPPPVWGAGVPDLSLGSPLAELLGAPYSPITLHDEQIRLPELLITRCGSTLQSRIIDYDDWRVGATNDFGSGSDLRRYGNWGTVVAPAQGTWSAPHAFQMDVVNQMRRSGSHDVVTSPGFTYFGFMVGLPTEHPGPVLLELSGLHQPTYDLVDLDRVQLGPEPGPATTCMVVVAPPDALLGRVALRAYALGAPGEDPPEHIPVTIDHVFWSTSERYPIPNTDVVADVEIIWPPEGTTLRTSGTGVIGRVRYPSAGRVSSVEVVSPTWDNTGTVRRRATMGRGVRDGGDVTRLFWVDRIDVPPGEFTVAASAWGTVRGATSVDANGRGRPVPPEDEYRTLATDTVDVVPWAMEVTQAVRGQLVVQEPDTVIADPFLHVARKRTVVRGYAVQTRPGEERTGQRLQADARLHGTRNGVTLPFSPLLPEATPVPLADREPGESAEAFARPAASNTFNFLLPNTWTTAGDIELRLEVNPADSMLHVPEVEGADGVANSIAQQVSFAEVGNVGVTAALINLHWECTAERLEAADEQAERAAEVGHPPGDRCHGKEEGDIVTAVATRTDVEHMVRHWWRMFPAPGDFPHYLQVGEVSVRHKGDGFSEWNLPRARVTGPLTDTSWENWRDAYYDIACDGPKVFPTRIRPPSMRDLVMYVTPRSSPIGGGCAWVGQRSAFRTSLASTTAAQEAAHTAGLEHSGNAHGEDGGGGYLQRFEGDHGQIGAPDYPAWGFDTSTMSVIRGASGEHVHDYMSYGGGVKWTALDTWLAMHRAFLQNQPIIDVRDGRQAGSPGAGTDSGGEPASPDDGADPAAATSTADAADIGTTDHGDVLIVSGTVDDDGVHLGALQRARPGVTSASDDGDVLVQLLASDGTVLTERRAALQPVGTHGVRGNDAFVVELPADVDHSGLRVKVPDREPVELSGGDSNADIVLTEVPTAGEGAVLWETDLEGPFTVEVSNDDGATWWGLGTTTDKTLPLNPSSSGLQGAGWRVRVQTQDGARVVAGETDGADFGVRPPVASIASPSDGSWHKLGMVEVAAVTDGFGGDTTFSWSMDGETLNVGQLANLPALAEGAVTLTLTATNAAGTDTDEITIEVGEDVTLDGFVDRWSQSVGWDEGEFVDGSMDHDGDGLLTAEEYVLGTDPRNPDTDGDGFSDGLEVWGAGDPLDPAVTPGPIHGEHDHLAGAVLAPDTETGSDSSRTGLVVALALVLLVGAGIGGVMFRARRRPAS